MYKIFKNGLLYKITNSKRCLDAIVDRFLSTWLPGDELLVEKNGEFFEKFFYF